MAWTTHAQVAIGINMLFITILFTIPKIYLPLTLDMFFVEVVIIGVLIENLECRSPKSPNH
jgi:hypothetical protein